MAARYNHPKLITLLLDHHAALSDDENCQNPLDMSVADSHDFCAMAIVSHERWREAMKSITDDKKIQLKEMVARMPDVALVCILFWHFSIDW